MPLLNKTLYLRAKVQRSIGRYRDHITIGQGMLQKKSLLYKIVHNSVNKFDFKEWLAANKVKRYAGEFVARDVRTASLVRRQQHIDDGLCSFKGHSSFGFRSLVAVDASEVAILSYLEGDCFGMVAVYTVRPVFYVIEQPTHTFRKTLRPFHGATSSIVIVWVL